MLLELKLYPGGNGTVISPSAPRHNPKPDQTQPVSRPIAGWTDSLRGNSEGAPEGTYIESIGWNFFVLLLQ